MKLKTPNLRALILQAKALQDLNSRGAYDAVINQFESGSVASTEASLGEYIKALARTDRLDNSALLRVLQVGNLLSASHLTSRLRQFSKS